MKNIQVIDGALNCSYSIFASTDEEFRAIFPASGQDIEFIKDVLKRLDRKKADKIFNRIWSRPIDKKKVRGIHGTLFYELDFKKKYYPTKKESELAT